MARIAETLYRPVRIQGQDVILVPEVVGAVPITEQHEYVELVPATNSRPAINVREADIEEARRAYPGLPVHGMWHTLIESGVVSFNHMLQVVPQNEFDGFYLFCEVGRANYSGVYEAGFFAADASFGLEEAYEIDPELGQLVLPETEAKLAKEMLQERRNALRASWTSLGVAALAVIVFGVLVDVALKQIFAHQYATLENKSSMLQEMRSGVEQLKNTRLTEVPDDSQTLERIASLWALDDSIRTANGSQDLDDPEYQFVISRLETDPSRHFDWLQSSIKPDGSWLVTFREEP